MRKRALVPLRNYKGFQDATVGWLTKEIFLSDEAIRELQDNVLSSAWQYWVSNNNLNEWEVVGDEFNDHASAFLVRTALESLFEELGLFLVLQLKSSIDLVTDLRLYFDAIAVDYIPASFENRKPHDYYSVRFTYRLGSLV